MLAPGVPYEQQLLAALDWAPNGDRILHLTDEERADLAASVRQALAELTTECAWVSIRGWTRSRIGNELVAALASREAEAATPQRKAPDRGTGRAAL